MFEIRDDEIDMEKIMARIRENLKQTALAGRESYDEDAAVFWRQEPVSLFRGMADHHLSRLSFLQDPKPQGAIATHGSKLIEHAKHYIRRLLAPYHRAIFARQAEFNANLVALVADLLRMLENPRGVEGAISGGQTPLVSPASQGAHVQAIVPELDYFRFAERFHGGNEKFKERRRMYVEYFKGHEPVLEIGCGKGEFLELLREASIEARGVDIDLEMVRVCREKGLDVQRKDACDQLEALPDESLGGIFLAQVIEHLRVPQIVKLIHLAYQKLSTGGVFIVETLNPESLLVHYRWFWMDLTHERLIHPETMKFLFDSAGFDEVTCRFLPTSEAQLVIPPLTIRDHPHDELERFNLAIDHLNKLLFGSPDYAMIGKKKSRKRQMTSGYENV